jgi:hypothetical protein
MNYFKAITTAYRNVQHAFSNINEGLQHHFEVEEKSLAPLIGNLLTQALAREHSELLNKLSKIRIMVNESNLDNLYIAQQIVTLKIN